jgi:hypothetical protein
MKRFMQILAAFGVLSLMLAGCNLKGEETVVEGDEDVTVEEDATLPVVEDDAATVTETTDEVAE